ncbi:MAG: ChrR family anti-sigma-E factor [Xanthobacteraceae bacterium]
MTITHHPSDLTLAALASGTLDEARAVVVAAHLSLCPHCREAMSSFENVGGVQLETAVPAEMSTGALERAIARVSAQVSEAGQGARPQRAQAGALPASLAPYTLGSWRWIGCNVQWRSVDVASDDGVRVFMLKAAAGTRLPRHRHSGTEWTCVFEGAFRHDFGRFGAGDFDEADELVEHNPVVEDGVPCVCLVALQGNIELQSWVGRLLQPFVRL